ncbi:MAG: hypothetical protein SGILL_006571 [Bacillariaceae sp.]
MSLLRSGIGATTNAASDAMSLALASASHVVMQQQQQQVNEHPFQRILETTEGNISNDDDPDADLSLRQNLNQILSSQWHRQNLGMPFGGAHSGVAVYDLNGDGYDDLLFAAGRHSVDTAYVLINLGLAESDSVDPDSSENLDFRFSDPLILRTGTFYQVDVSPLSSLEEGHLAVLLAGGNCKVCSQNYQPARLLDVYATGCSVENPDGECELFVKSEVLWLEPGRQDSGNRNGALSMELGNGIDPAIVLVGTGGLSIYHPKDNGTYNKGFPDYLLRSQDKVTAFDDFIDRSAGLAIGKIGQKTGIVLGTRSKSRNPGPTAMVIVYQERTEDGEYMYTRWNVDADTPELYADSKVSLEKTGVALADLNGDGNVDIISIENVRQVS